MGAFIDDGDRGSSCALRGFGPRLGARGSVVAVSLIDHQIHQLSASARKRLEKDEIDLTARRAELVAEQGSETGGDLVDQASFATQQIEIESIDRRLSRIRELLSATTVATDAPEDTVAVGSVVTLRFDDGSTESYQVGLIEEQVDDVVALTPTSPLGRALLGQKVGDKVTYAAPVGELTVEIVKVAGS
ncbi:GreA/GreB family elongation factor [Actinopolymorpha pittospori]|uniref:GreA/GreB family elongation factor n=1 Tax=Actinopolymorpha pittospori TaxID=648752 RepID=UPI001EE23A65|nr:GreA/GreB family elongation factor [Actinopolymorpha pittospori]